MKKIKLSNGVEMPQLGYGVYQVEPDPTLPLTHIGEKYGKTAAQVALRWLLQSDVIISRDVISDMHTTEFHMMLTSDH